MAEKIENVSIMTDGTPMGTEVKNSRGEFIPVQSIDIHVGVDEAWIYVQLPLGRYQARIDIKNVTLEPVPDEPNQ